MTEAVHAKTVRFPRDVYERMRDWAFKRREFHNDFIVEAVQEKIDRLDAEALPTREESR